MSRQHTQQQGFTIVELMIATTVLSVILLLVSGMMINIGNLFYKAVNQARVQDNVRGLTDEISQQLQLDGQAPTEGRHTRNIAPFVTVRAYCIGDVRYSYVVGYKIGNVATTDTNGTTPLSTHVLWRDYVSKDSSDVISGYNKVTDGGCPPIDVTQPITHEPARIGTELIAPNSRLTAFCIGALSGGNCSIATQSPYLVSIGVAYGDIDLLNGATPGSQTLGTTCRGSTADQFCATATLSTLVLRRIGGGN